MNAFTLFGVGPYVALGVAVVGLVVRVLSLGWGDKALDKDQAGAPRSLLGWDLVGGRLGGLAMLLLLAGHALLLMAPDRVLRWDASPTGLFVVEGSGFLIGVMVVAGVAVGVVRHLGAARGSRAAEIADAVFLASLSLSLACGLYTAARYRWASSWGAATVAPYAQSLWQRRPAPSLIGEVPFSARLHITAALAAVATLPTSRLGAALVLGAGRLFVAAGVAAETGARGLVGWLRPQRLFALIWPEDDLMDLARLSRRRARAQRPARAVPVVETLPIAPAATDNDVQPPSLSAEGH